MRNETVIRELSRRGFIRLSLWSSLLLAAGCTKKGIVLLKPLVSPRIKYCHDRVEHIPGAKSWIDGGTCCCTPKTEALRERYRKAGITTDWNHQGCNNLCEYGPHVVKGGKCMAIPTPGTDNYEEVTTGWWNGEQH